VPLRTYRTSRERLVAGEAWGRLPGAEPFIGVQGDGESDAARIVRVFPASPAAQAGVQVGDVITAFAGKEIADFRSLQLVVEEQEPGTVVKVEVLRGGMRLQLTLEVGDRRG
jgi:S1-C subfamily serine protease